MLYTFHIQNIMLSGYDRSSAAHKYIVLQSHDKHSILSKNLNSRITSYFTEQKSIKGIDFISFSHRLT